MFTVTNCPSAFQWIGVNGVNGGCHVSYGSAKKLIPVQVNDMTNRSDLK